MSSYVNAMGECITYFAPTTSPVSREPGNKEEGNNPMYMNTAPAAVKMNSVNAGAGVVINAGPEENQFTIMEEQRKYIARLALDAVEDIREKIAMKYKIGRIFEHDLRPKTVQEAAARLKAGDYTMRGADKKDPVVYPYMGLQDVFSWRGPKDQPDKEGYDAAIEDFMAFSGPLMTEIRIFDPKEGLESYKKIEAYQI